MDGNILWLCDPYSVTSETPNIKSVLDLYGVNIRQDGFVIEQDSDRMVMGNPDLILPNITSSEVTKDIDKVLFLTAGKLEFADDLESLNVVKTDLLTTTSSAFFRTNIQEASIIPVEGEQTEKIVVGAELRRTTADDKNVSKLVIFSNNTFVTDKGVYVGNGAMPSIAFYGNKDLLINSVEYLSEVEDSLTIKKKITTTLYTATETQDRVIKIIIYTVPFVIVAAGIVVTILRRRKK